MPQPPKPRPGVKRRPPADIDLTAREIREDHEDKDIREGTSNAAATPASVSEPVAASAAGESAPFDGPPSGVTERIPAEPPQASAAAEASASANAEPKKSAPSEPGVNQARTSSRRVSNGILVKAVAAGAVAGAAFGILAAVFVPVLKGRPKSIDIVPIETRLSALEKREAAPDARLQALSEQIAELQRQLAAQRDALGEANKAIASVRQTASAGISNEIAPLAARLQGLEQSGQALASKVSGVASGQSTSVAASLLAATQALSASFERGAPLQPELKAVEAISGNSNRLAALRPYAAAGAPTIRTLSERFRALKPSLLAAEAPPASNGILDRLAASASSIVKVTPVGAQPGSDTVSVVSRIEAALQRGDLDLVLREAAGLPEKPALAAAPWLTDVKARQSAAAALRGLESDAVEVIGAASR